MTVAILDIRPTPELGVEPPARRAGDAVLLLEFKPRASDRRGLLCRWRRDGDTRVVCVWESALVRSGSLLRRSGRALTRSSSTVSRSDQRRGE
jgi:hypothetical protein